MKKFAFMNQKGGVGKTTLARNVAECLVRQGKKVLLVDLDHQANLTLSLNVKYIIDQKEEDREEDCKNGVNVVEFCIGDMFDKNFFKAVEIKPLLHLLPNEIGFADKEIVLQARFSRENILANIISEVADVYDYALFDCPPSFGTVTANAFVAADALIVPVQPSEFSFRGLEKMIQNIAFIKKVDSSFFKVVLNDFEENTIEGQAAIARLSTLKNAVVLETKIHRAQAIKQAERLHQTVFDLSNKRVQEEFENLTNEIK